jgi:hypothetical protein
MSRFRGATVKWNVIDLASGQDAAKWIEQKSEAGFEAGRAREAARGEQEVVQSELQLERNMTCRELSSISSFR